MPPDATPRVRRFDAGQLAPAEHLENGWLRAEGRSAKCGILEYENPDGSKRRELVVPEEMFAAASMASARMVPVTNDHPSALLDGATAKIAQVGSVGENLRPDGDYLVAPLMVTDGATVKAITDGKAELSWGYDCEMAPPDPALVDKWGEHDGRQTKRRYNHLAVVEKARAGDGARIRLDAAGNQEFAGASGAVLSFVAAQQAKTAEVQKMPPLQVRVDNNQYGSDDPALQQAIDRLVAQGRKDAADAIAAEKAKLDAATVKLNHLKANALQRGAIVRSLTAKFDAMKARMIDCDECGGTGKVGHDDKVYKSGAGNPHGTKAEANEENKAIHAYYTEKGDAKSCDYCHGTGKIRMHDAIKAMPGGEPEGPEQLDEPDGDEPEMVDDDSLETESPEECKIAKIANPEHKDAARAARKDAQKRRADSLGRMVARAAQDHAALLTEAGKHTGADVKLDTMTPTAIKSAVLAKLAPHIKLDGLDASAVDLFYSAELARVAAQRTDTAGASDVLRAAMMRTGGAAGQASLEDRLDAARKARDERNANAYKTPAPAAKK